MGSRVKRRLLASAVGLLVGLGLLVAALSERPAVSSVPATPASTPINYEYGATQIAAVATIAREHCGQAYFGTQC